jgi:hypothetical protein
MAAIRKPAPAKSKKPIRKSSKKKSAISTEGSEDSMDVDDLIDIHGTSSPVNGDPEAQHLLSEVQLRSEEVGMVMGCLRNEKRFYWAG